MMRPTLYLIDAHAYIHRAYHALPPLTSTRGQMVNAVYGFTKLLFKILREKKPDHMAVCFDHPSPLNRKKIFPEYKATRKPVDEDLKIQIPLVKKSVDLLGLASVSVAGYEADDLIATLARKGVEKNCSIVIVTGDKDALQLVSDNVTVWNAHKDIMIDPREVELLHGMKPEQMIDYFSLMGDASDNIPGVPGVGKKTALKLMQEFKTLDGVYEKIGSIPDTLRAKLVSSKDKALLSRRLVTLDANVPIPAELSDMPGRMPEASDKLLEFFNELGFKSLLKELNVSPSQQSLAGKQYSLIDNEKELARILNSLARSGIFALDVETTGLNTFVSELLGISFSGEKNKAWYVPLKGAHKGIYRMVKDFLGDPSHKIIGHNLKFDYLVLKHAGIGVPGIYFDTMLASYLLNPSRNSHRLKNLALEFFSLKMTEYADLVGTGKNKSTLDQIDLKKLVDYACADADAAYMLYEVMVRQLEEKKLQKLFFDVEMPLLKILADMEKEGVKIDVSYLHELSVQFAGKLKKLEHDVYESAGQEFNINSPKQLSVVLFEKLKLPVIRRTKTGFSTDDDVLEELAERHHLPKVLRSFREIQKLKSTYIDAIGNQVDPVTSRLHTSFNQAVTATGRLSSSNPNLQNIPVRTENGRMIRKAFIPAKGYLFISADYSQIDLRVLAHLSNDEALVTAFKSGDDIHKATASEIYGVPPDEVSAEMRSRAKAINFGIVYGQQAFGLAQTLNISRAAAKEFIDNYFKKYAGVKVWIDNTLEHAKQTGMVSTILGRIRYLPELSSGQPRMQAFGERLAMNTPIQGSSSDIIKAAMVHIDRELRMHKYKSKMLIQIHDDLLFEVHEDESTALQKLIKDKMEHSVTLSIPLVVDMKMGKNWRDLTPVS